MHNYWATRGSTQACVQRWRTFPSDTGAFLRASTCASANLIDTFNFPPRKVHYDTISSAARALYNATAVFHRSLSGGRAEARLHFHIVALLPSACIHCDLHHTLLCGRSVIAPPGVTTGSNNAWANRLFLAPQTFICILCCPRCATLHTRLNQNQS